MHLAAGMASWEAPELQADPLLGWVASPLLQLRGLGLWEVPGLSHAPSWSGVTSGCVTPEPPLSSTVLRAHPPAPRPAGTRGVPPGRGSPVPEGNPPLKVQ